MKIAVTGASGYIGRFLVKQAIDQGHNVKALAFSSVPSDALSTNQVIWLRGSINDAEIVNRLLLKSDIVIHCASFVHRQTTTPEQKALCQHTNVDGTRLLLDVARSLSPTPFVVYLSTTAVYTPSDEVGDEDSPCEPVTLYGQTKLEAEQILLGYIDKGKVQGCILRPSMVYGPHAPGNMQRLFALVNRGVVPLIDGGHNRKSIVYIENLARMIDACVQVRASINGQIFNCSDAPVLTMREIVELIAAHLSKKPLFLSFPHAAVQPVLLAHDVLLGKRRKVTYLPTLHAFAETSAVRSDRLTEATPYQQHISVDEGLRLTAQDFLAHAR